MSQTRMEAYTDRLVQMIRIETVSSESVTDGIKFQQFRALLRDLFPHLFTVCEEEDFDHSMLLCIKGTGNGDPILFMNHFDVVEASGTWKYPPFSGTVAEGKLWGRGTLDTKGGLFAMLQAADELAASGFLPERDLYFVSTCTEETTGQGADRISAALKDRGIRFAMVLDEGGMILPEPIDGAKGTFAMIGLGEKGCADLKFIARSNGGHASTPGKDTPLVRLGKFMAKAEKAPLFTADLSPAICRMFQTLSVSMAQPLRFVLGHPKLFRLPLLAVIPKVSTAAGAMLKTTLAFTMAHGSEGTNVLPQEAYVIGNMRYSHHQGREDSIEAVRRLAAEFDIETEVLDAGFPSPVTDPQGEPYRLVEQVVRKVFPDVIPTPYLMTGASDSRYMSRVCDHCLRFAPFRITHEQMDSIHGCNEHVDLSSLVPAVDFYRTMMKEAAVWQTTQKAD